MSGEYSFKSKVISIDEALSKIKSNDCVISALGAAEPKAILEQLHTIADRVRGVTVSTTLPLHNGRWFTDPAMKGHFMHQPWFATGASRKADGLGTCSFVPCHLSTAGQDRLKYHLPNVFLGTCTPPDRFGFISLSLSATYERELMEAADIVILEMNDKMPWTYGDTIIHLDAVDY
ncbi:MAG: Ach1, partial [Proteobacteria bacterium]|nr:Ach1 [Pseudomonadota bacterium]